MFAQGAFQIDPNATPEEVARRRAAIRRMLDRPAAKYVGEGMTHLAQGILGGLSEYRTGKTERAGKAKATELFEAATASAGDPLDIVGRVRERGGSGDPSGGALFPASLVQSESGGNWNALNNEEGAGGHKGHGGRLQFGTARLADAARAGVIPAMTAQEFAQQPPEVQQAVENWHFQDIDQNIGSMGLDQFEGQVVNGVPVTRDGIRAMAHLGGIGGAAKFLQTGGQHNPADAYGTSLMDYLQMHGGGGGSSVDTSAIREALANPWISQAQRQVLQGMLDEQQRNSDPLRQIQIETAQAQLERLRSPEPKARKTMTDANGRQRYVDTGELVFPDVEVAPAPGFSMLPPERAAELGLEGPHQIGPDGRITKIGGGGTNVTVNNGGQSVEPLGNDGQILVPDPTLPSGFRVEVAPGSNLARERAAEAEAADSAARTSAQNASDRVRVVRRATDSVREKIAKQNENGSWEVGRDGLIDLPETGIWGERLGRWGINQEAVDVAADIETLKGMVVFDRLEKLREASANGSSGLGQVTNVEIGLLGAQMGALRQDMSAGKIMETLDMLDDVFGRLSPEAQQYLMGESDNLPPASAGGQPAPASNIPDFSTMTDEQLDAWIAQNG